MVVVEVVDVLDYDLGGGMLVVWFLSVPDFGAREPTGWREASRALAV